MAKVEPAGAGARRRSSALPAAVCATGLGVALLALDGLPALRHIPLILLALGVAVQVGRELCGALALRERYPSSPVVSSLIGLIVLHLAYFRRELYWEGVLLCATVLLAIFVLVAVFAVGTDLKTHGAAQGLRDLGLTLLLSLGAGVGFGAATGLQVAHWSLAPGAPPEAQAVGLATGAHLVALVVAAALAGHVVALFALPSGPRQEPPVGLLLRLAAAVVILVAGSWLPSLRWLGAGHAVALAVLVAGAMWCGALLVRRLAAVTDIESFRYPLPRQAELLQPVYDALCVGGLTTLAGPLALTLPLAYAYIAWVVR